MSLLEEPSIWDPEIDFGTPAVRDAESLAAPSVTVTIDGRPGRRSRPVRRSCAPRPRPG